MDEVSTDRTPPELFFDLSDAFMEIKKKLKALKYDYYVDVYVNMKFYWFFNAQKPDEWKQARLETL